MLVEQHHSVGSDTGDQRQTALEKHDRRSCRKQQHRLEEQELAARSVPHRPTVLQLTL